MIHEPIRVDGHARITAGQEANRLALAVYDALLADLAVLSPDDWQRPTECEPWTVHDMVAHLVGAAKGHASMREFLRQEIKAQRRKDEFDGSDLDALNQVQIDEHTHLSPAQLKQELGRLAPLAVAGRARSARWLGWVPLPLPASGSAYSGMPAKTTMRELSTVVLTRDVWMHRFDLNRTTGSPTQLVPAVDGRLVADAAVEWCLRHGQPVDLALTGRVGGTFVSGVGGPRLEMDALDFVRHLAGRRPEGQLPDSPLLATRLLF